jgi:hypothetical protein
VRTPFEIEDTADRLMGTLVTTESVNFGSEGAAREMSMPQFTRVLVTTEYLNAHRPEGGTWTQAQLDALGVKRRAHQSWRTRLIGKWITWEQAQQFEVGRAPDVATARQRRLQARHALQPEFWRP